MLKMRQGCSVPFPQLLTEGYTSEPNRLIANVDADKMQLLVERFVMMHEERQFFILELPSDLKRQKLLRPGVVGALQKDVYYIDGCTPQEACDMFSQIAQLLINDGLCAFGFGCHESHAEIMVDKYNVVTVYSKDPDRYRPLFERHGIPYVSQLTTAWDTFSRWHCGDCRRVETDGKSIFDLPDMLKDRGIYLYEQREE